MQPLLGPGDLVQLVLEQFFGRASLVVFVWVLVTALIGWIELARFSGKASQLISGFFAVSEGDFGWRSGKVRTTLRLAWIWILLYGIASFVTQLWAGSEFSPGQGGGLAELLTWSAAFGALTLLGTLLLLPRQYANAGIYSAPLIGYVIGLVYAVVNFTQRGGPTPGDWWVAPAASCTVVLVVASYARLRQISAGAARA